MPDLTLRPATPADAPAIAALIGDLAHYFVADPAATSVQPFLGTFKAEAIAGLLGKPEFFALCAEAGGELQGVITLHRPAHVHHLFVRPTAHRRGIARQLWQAAQAELPEESIVTVNSSEYAAPVYQRLGFTPSAGVQERNGVRYVPMHRLPAVATALTLRPATVDDLPALSLLFAAYRAFYEQPFSLPVARAFLLERLQQGQSRLLLATTGPVVHGFCQIYPSFCSVLAAPIGVLYDLYVLPESRRHGAGRALLLAAEDVAAEAGWQRLDLTTAHTNHGAQALYEGLGWQLDTVFRAYTKPIPPRSLP